MSEPDFRKSASLPAADDHHAVFMAWRELCVAAEQAGCAFVRMTVVCDEHPNDAVADGFYIEGWISQPDEQPAFAWPVEVAS